MATKPRRVTRQLAAQERAKENSTFESLPVSAPRRRWQRGLERLTEMPLDIVMEIMSYLGPMDLLHLIRTNKAFRRFLLARACEPLWKAARKNVDLLPECPEHMSEPAYANLVFDAHCHKCLKSGTKTVHWSFGARYCPTCRITMLVKCSGGECMFGDTCSDALMPHIHEHASYAHFHHLPDVEWLEEKGKKLETKEASARKRAVSKIMNHASECEDWQDELADARQTELHNLRQRRFDNVVRKLEDLGFGEDLATMQHSYLSLKKHPDVKPARELTDHAWQTIQPRVVKFMQTYRRERLNTERCDLLLNRGRDFADVYQEWWARQDERAVLPSWLDMLRRIEVRPLIDQPNDVDVTRDAFEPLRAHFPQWTKEWREERDAELRTIVLDSSEFKGKIPEGIDPLSLASVVFNCARCHCRMYSEKYCTLPPIYPSILGHMHLYGYVDARNISLKDPLECALLCAAPTDWHSDIRDGSKWSSGLLNIGVLHRCAAEVIKACGKDPMTTTREEMDQLDVRFWCETCSAPSRGQQRQVMKWRDTLLHYVTHGNVSGLKANASFKSPIRLTKDRASLNSPSNLGVKWSVMSGDIVDTIKDLERQANPFFERDFKTSPEARWYDCTHCSEAVDYSYPELEEHLLDDHNIEHAQHHDVYRTPGSDLTMVQPITLIKPKPTKELTDLEADLFARGRAYFCDF